MHREQNIPFVIALGSGMGGGESYIAWSDRSKTGDKVGREREKKKRKEKSEVTPPRPRHRGKSATPRLIKHWK